MYNFNIVEISKNFLRKISVRYYFHSKYRYGSRSILTIKPRYIVLYGFAEWKKKFMSEWFSEYEIIFLPKGISKEEFNKIEKSISRKSIDFFGFWGMDVSDYVLRFVNDNDIKKLYIEDGFIRSKGLGANHIIPLSLVMDSRTLYYDSNRLSDLEVILNGYKFNDDIINRSKKIRRYIIDNCISKYNQGEIFDINEIYGIKNRKRVLVVGQVESDASIRFGCDRNVTNADLIDIAIRENPSAKIIYKPHPDVINKLRSNKSHVEYYEDKCLILDIDININAALETIDRVYTITSLAGFEALIRGIDVTTIGCPFYSGWGLTDDRQKSIRRKRKLCIHELIAGVLIIYPYYFNHTSKRFTNVEDVIHILKD